MTKDSDKPALPKKWITPLRLLAYAIIAGSSAFIYFNARDLEYTHLLIFIPTAVICSMLLLDCRMSIEYWEKLEKDEKKQA